jgi:CRP/FNR family transcriptional regulator, cyclic AMP receptor protein
MTLPQTLGFLASGLVLVTFGMRTMVPMRLAAISSNLAFIAYALLLGLTPVWILHSILLPLNVYRLLESRRMRRRGPE